MTKETDYESVLKRIEALEARVKTLTEENKALHARLDASSSTIPASSSMSYKKVLCGNKIDDEATVCMLATVRKEVNEASKRQNNMIIAGLADLTGEANGEEADNNQIYDVIRKLEVNRDDVRRARRLNTKSGKKSNLVIVEMVSEEARNKALKNAPKLVGRECS